MSSILDIDLDYFTLLENPTERLNELLVWANSPVRVVVERHHRLLREWKTRIRRGRLSPPTHVLHVDEHHDMMDERMSPNISNWVCHAMRTWTDCRIHWMVEEAIDSPRVWLSEETWKAFVPRFTSTRHLPRNWPMPDVVSVCTSPEFVSPSLGRTLMGCIRDFNERTASSPSVRSGAVEYDCPLP